MKQWLIGSLVGFAAPVMAHHGPEHSLWFAEVATSVGIGVVLSFAATALLVKMRKKA